MKKIIIALVVISLFLLIQVSGCIDIGGRDKKKDSPNVIEGLTSVSYQFSTFNTTQTFPEDSYLLIPMVKQNRVTYQISSDDLTMYKGYETEPSPLIEEFNISDELTDYGRVLRISPIRSNRTFMGEIIELRYDLIPSDPVNSTRLPIFSTQEEFGSSVWIYSTHHVDNFYFDLEYTYTTQITIVTNLGAGWHQYKVHQWDPSGYD